jgi:hypothetical protein
MARVAAGDFETPKARRRRARGPGRARRGNRGPASGRGRDEGRGRGRGRGSFEVSGKIKIPSITMLRFDRFLRSAGRPSRSGWKQAMREHSMNSYKDQRASEGRFAHQAGGVARREPTGFTLPGAGRPPGRWRLQSGRRWAGQAPRATRMWSRTVELTSRESGVRDPPALRPASEDGSMQGMHNYSLPQARFPQTVHIRVHDYAINRSRRPNAPAPSRPACRSPSTLSSRRGAPFDKLRANAYRFLALTASAAERPASAPPGTPPRR